MKNNGVGVTIMKSKHRSVTRLILLVATLLAYSSIYFCGTAMAAQPDTVYVDVWQIDVNNTSVYIGEYPVKESEGWYLKIPGLDKYDGNGDLYTYVVSEKNISGYISSVCEQIDSKLDAYYFFVVNTAVYTVTYNGNGHTGGSVPTDLNSPHKEGSAVTVLGRGSLVRSGYTFNGWAASSMGPVARTPGQVFTITENTTLYAQWSYDGGYGGGDPVLDPDIDPDPDLATDPDTDPDLATDTDRPNQPTPNNGNTLVPNDDGGFRELGEDGTLLGEWRWDEDEKTWDFIPYVPLVGLPQAGDTEATSYAFFLMGISLLGRGVVLRLETRYRGRHER